MKKLYYTWDCEGMNTGIWIGILLACAGVMILIGVLI